MNRLQTVERIIVHHSGGASGNVAQFRDQHINVNGWDDIGYHFVICNGRGGADGLIQHGRSVMFEGAHCPTQNACSIGVCLVGDFQHGGEPSLRQRLALVQLLASLCLVYALDPGRDISDHNDYRATECPGVALEDLLPMVRTAVAQELAQLGIRN